MTGHETVMSSDDSNAHANGAETDGFHRLVDVTSTDDGYRVTPTAPAPVAPSTLVIAGVARVLEVHPDDLRPRLSEVLDPDALDRLVRSQSGGAIAFEAWDCRVTVRADRTVEIATRDGT